MTQLTDNIYAVPVPEDATKYLVMKVCQPQTFSYEYSISKGNGKFQSGLIAFIDLPPGNWQFLFTSKECTEEQAAKVVERQKSFGKYKCYDLAGTSYVKYGAYFIDTALESLHSLLRASGCDPEKSNYAILKKEDKV